ncbi:MAG: nitrilase-related carbon-nitrogen hydrolase [Verrucomicrobiota bacterium]
MNPSNSCEELNWKQTILYSFGAISSFHLAYTFSQCSFLIAVFLFCLFRLANLNTSRKAFYIGSAIGMAIYAPQLGFFWNIFKGAAIALWAIIAFWLGLFLLLSQATRKRFGAKKFALIVPFLWLGLEYFRSELYYLRFSWMNVGYAFSASPKMIQFSCLGIYGIGFLLMGIIAALSLFRRKLSCALTTVFIAVLGIVLNLPSLNLNSTPPTRAVAVAGVQMEFPPEAGVTFVLDRLIKKFPKTELVVLSEYTFDGPIPEKVKAWCRKNQKYLIAGGKQLLPQDKYYNTAFVIDPNGEIIFRQVKSVPIQFFKDGLPAPEQKLWDSPWGKIGICICYDLSYRRVVDELVRQGAQAIIVPTMDVVDWGKHQHELHARVAPTRAAEYGVPIFRVCSSGISQLINAQGEVEASALFPGDEAMLDGTMRLSGRGNLPLDYWLAPFASIFTGILALWLGLASFKKKNKPLHENIPAIPA